MLESRMMFVDFKDESSDLNYMTRMLHRLQLPPQCLQKARGC